MEAIIVFVIEGFFIVVARMFFAMLFASPLYWAWNESMVLFGLPALNLGSAFCLLVVAALILPSSPSKSSK